MVNTFVTDSNPKIIAKNLDSRRLGKQRVEAFQIIKALEGKTKGWKNHPATKAWEGHIEALKDYYNIMINEWISRGYNNNMILYPQRKVYYPEWFFSEKIQNSHKARLIQKDPDFYLKIFNPPDVYLKYGYIWPHKWSTDELAQLPVEKLAEKFVKINFCNGIKASGKACNNKALYQGFCGVHKTQGVKKTVSLCIAVCKNGNACKYKAKFGNKCGIHKSL